MVENLIIGVLSIILGGSAVWFAARAFRALNLKRGADFLGLERGGSCRLVVGKYHDQAATSHRDVSALVDAVAIIQPFDPDVIVASSDDALEPVGDVTEFCIGGPDSNRRTIVHMREFLPGVKAYSYKDEEHRLEIRTERQSFSYKRGKREHAILAKIVKNLNSKPLFLVCGQTAIANRGALHYLHENYHSMLRKRYCLGRFCVIVCLVSPEAYGHKMVEEAEDVTETAFSPTVSIT